jgi:eukaryotic-like serine/threonine-protein kinase
MNICHECGSEITGNDAFCPYCGIMLMPPVPAEPISDDEMASTIMMPADEAARLAAEMSTEDPSEEKVTDSAVNFVEDTDPTLKEKIAAAAAAPENHPEEVPVPGILSEYVQTSSDVNARRTTEYGAEDLASSEIPSDEGRSDDSAGLAAEPAEANQDSIREIDPDGTDSTAPEVIAIDESAVVPSVHGDAEPREMDGLSDSSDLSDPVTQTVSAELTEGAQSMMDSAGTNDEPTPGILMPADELPEHDPFSSGSMFDSVRIMEHEIPDLQSDIDTILGMPIPSVVDPLIAQKDPSAKLEREDEPAASHTASNIGETGTDGKRSSKLKPLAEGTILNSRYEIIRKIGGGGMGAVYLASDNNLGGVLRAVKEMIQAHIEDEQQEKAINDFRRESMILSTLDHSAIPTIFDYFYDEAESRFYLVMKYISGGDLSSRLRSAPEGKIDEITVTEWAIQIADVLDYLHSQPSTIVYRDLKPSNIMVDGNTGRVMLIDFGIARSISQKEEKGVTAVGTMGYAPPELFSGNVEPRSDIYSLGSTIFHLMTGADPQSNPLLIFDFQKNPRPRQINPRLSDQMERILMKAVEYNADARFSSAAEIRKVLEDHLADLRSGKVTYGVSVAPAALSLADQKVFCGFCGQRIVATDLFCAFCGAKQPIGQPGVHSGAYPKAAATAKLFVEGTSELSAPTFSLQKDEILVGRRDPMSNIFPEVDLSKYDPQTKISRRHARIWRDGNNFLVEDLGSSNGTVLASSVKDSFRLVPHRPHPLVSGDKLKIGDTTLHFLVG